MDGLLAPSFVRPATWFFPISARDTLAAPVAKAVSSLPGLPSVRPCVYPDHSSGVWQVPTGLKGSYVELAGSNDAARLLALVEPLLNASRDESVAPACFQLEPPALKRLIISVAQQAARCVCVCVLGAASPSNSPRFYTCSLMHSLSYSLSRGSGQVW